MCVKSTKIGNDKEIDRKMRKRDERVRHSAEPRYLTELVRPSSNTAVRVRGKKVDGHV